MTSLVSISLVGTLIIKGTDSHYIFIATFSSTQDQILQMSFFYSIFEVDKNHIFSCLIEL